MNRLIQGLSKLQLLMQCLGPAQVVVVMTPRIVNWCFESGQPLGIISGLKETFLRRYIVERTNKADIRPEEQSENAESCQANSWNEIQSERP